MANVVSGIAILPVQSNDNSFNGTRLIEEASQTFYSGTPVSIDSSDGGVQAWVVNTQGPGQGGICGISYEAAHNFATTGLSAPTPFQPYSGQGSQLTFGNVPNEPSAVNIALGSPFVDGRIGFILPGPDTVFSATTGNGTTPASTVTPTNAIVGNQYGLTYSNPSSGGNGYWYVDVAKTTAGTNTVLTVVGLDLRDAPNSGHYTSGANTIYWTTRVLFVFLPTVVNLLNY